MKTLFGAVDRPYSYGTPPCNHSICNRSINVPTGCVPACFSPELPLIKSRCYSPLFRIDFILSILLMVFSRNYLCTLNLLKDGFVDDFIRSKKESKVLKAFCLSGIIGFAELLYSCKTLLGRIVSWLTDLLYVPKTVLGVWLLLWKWFLISHGDKSLIWLYIKIAASFLAIFLLLPLPNYGQILLICATNNTVSWQCVPLVVYP